VVITLDLGADVPLRGLSYNTAAGVAGVEFPTSIMALISVDGRAFHALGDLVALSMKHGVPPAGKYGVHRFWTDAVQAHGRYLKLLVDPAGAYCFVDEIEVFLGAAAWAQLPMPGREIRYPMEYFQDNLFNAAVKRRIGYDLEAVRTVLAEAGLEAAALAAAKQEIAAIEKAIGEQWSGRVADMNVRAVRKAYEMVSEPVDVSRVKPEDMLKPMAGDRDVSSWRLYKPELDKDKCIGCRRCYILCPEVAISMVDKKADINYRYCKGCGICVEECPVKAIEFVQETI